MKILQYRFILFFLVLQINTLFAQKLDRLNEIEYDKVEFNPERVFLHNDSLITVITESEVFNFQL